MDIGDLEAILLGSWRRETSSDPANWSENNPAWGQCAVTACIVNDHFGGKLLWADARLPDGRVISHYFNRLQNEEIVDLTKIQFPKGTVISEGMDRKKAKDGVDFNTTKDYVLSYPQTMQRYEILKKAVDELRKD